MRLGVVLLLLLMRVLLGGVMIVLPLFWFADPRTPGCSPGCGKSDPRPSLPPGNCPFPSPHVIARSSPR